MRQMISVSLKRRCLFCGHDRLSELVDVPRRVVRHGGPAVNEVWTECAIILECTERVRSQMNQWAKEYFKGCGL